MNKRWIVWSRCSVASGFAPVLGFVLGKGEEGFDLRSFVESDSPRGRQNIGDVESAQKNHVHMKKKNKEAINVLFRSQRTIKQMTDQVQQSDPFFWFAIVQQTIRKHLKILSKRPVFNGPRNYKPKQIRSSELLDDSVFNCILPQGEVSAT